MKLKKSQLKDAIKSIARECLNERLVKQQEQVGADVVSQESNVDDKEKLNKVVAFVIKKLPQYKDDPDKLAMVAGELYSRQYNTEADSDALQQAVAGATPAGTEDECSMEEASYKQVAPKQYTDTKTMHARTVETDPTVTETERPTLPPNKGAYKVVQQHVYTDTDQNKPLTVQTDPKVNENDKWIQKAVKHPGRCAHMGSPECPEGSPQYNLAKRFKKGDIHQDNLKKECGACDEAGLTSEEDAIGGEEHPYDEREEIKLIKVMKLAADKLEAMHKGMPGAEEPCEPAPFGGEEEPCEPVDGDEDSEEPSSDPFSSADDDNDEEENEPKFEKIPKKKKGKKEEDPTEFTKKLAKEYKVQKRSYRTSDDTSYDPKNIVDPEIPGT